MCSREEKTPRFRGALTLPMRHAIQYCAQAGTDPSVTDPVPIIVLSEQVYHRTVRSGEELCVKPKK